MVILTNHLSGLRKQLPNSIDCLYWEDIMRYFDKENIISKFSDLGDDEIESKYSMRDSLVRLDQYLIESRTELLAKIFFIPFGMEDEGVILANWLKEKNGKNTYIATLHRPMDCFDLLVGDAMN